MSEKVALLVTEKEKRLIEELRKIKYGHCTVIMVDGQPARIEKPLEEIKL